MKNLQTRYMVDSDIRQVLLIDSAEPDLPVLDLADYQIILSKRKKYRPIVLTQGRSILAYLIIQFKNKCKLVYRAAVQRDFDELVSWSMFLADLKGSHGDGDDDKIVVQIPERDLRMQLFFKGEGFVATQIYRDALENGDSVYQMEWDSPTSSDSAEGGGPCSRRSPQL